MTKREREKMLQPIRQRLRQVVAEINGNISNATVQWLLVFGGKDALEESVLEEFESEEPDSAFEDAFLQTRDDKKKIELSLIVRQRKSPTDLDAIPNHLFLNANLDGGVLPSDPKQLYNALTAVRSPLELDLRPDTDDPNFPKIVVMGIRTSIHFVTVEELGAATFIFLVEQLLKTRDAVHTLLGGGDYQDHWREDWDYWKD